ncbi:MAG: hypothetical protein R3Y40_04105 [Eubacteriales bacterium]
MKVILEEYGKILIYSLVGVVVIGVVIVGIRSWYEASYPSLEQNSGISVDVVTEYPVLLVDEIEICMDDIEGNVDFSEYAIAYENNKLEVEIPVTIIGTELVDLETKGMYQIVFQVTGSEGKTFHKNIPVLIY